MKRYDGLWEHIATFEALYAAYEMARAKRHFRPEIMGIGSRIEDVIHELLLDLETGEWRPQKCYDFECRKEVKRRIMLGSFVLSSGYFDAYYKKALQVRGLIKRSFDDVFSRYDMIISPVSPTTAYKIGGQISDPVAMYMADIYTVSVNLTGVPSISLPCGFSSEGLPIGMQFIGDSFAESKLIKAASAYQEMTDFHRRRPASFAQGGADELPEMKNKERSAAE